MANSSPNRRPSTTSSRATRGSHETCDTASTAPSSVHGSPQMAKEPVGSWSRPPPPAAPVQQHLAQPQPQIRFQSSTTAASQDVSPGTSIFPRDSVDTYDSTMDSEMGDVEEEDDLVDDDDEVAPEETEYVTKRKQHLTAQGWAPKIPALSEYMRQPEHDVIPSNPQTFARLFPSTDRLLIRHDDLTADGNMNLRVDTVVPGSGRRRQSTTVQLFHLRMHDLDRREFSLRRYCRDSGREVCKSKRRFTDDNAPGVSQSASLGIGPAMGAEARRPSISRSVSSALKVLNPRSAHQKSPPGTRRPSAVSMLFGGGANGVGRSNTGSSYEADDEALSSSSSSSTEHQQKSAPRVALAPPAPTNTIKLEFSNYARVDVSRLGARGAKRYEFEWWGHTYSWKRVVDRNVEGVVSYHLVRDGQGAPVAHIVPESRTPGQVRDEVEAGGWVPPCYMWISDETIPNAMTDVADIIVATGLMALVDDSIKNHWHEDEKRPESRPRRASAFAGLESSSPRALMSHFFGARRHSEQPSSPLRVYDSSS
jgi:hypothetical protein